ncbi:MAG: 50S ribosomal protein L37e [Candidatus Thermoplasmatota archaeon]|nr:50S ribosomal protein L37e [Candidatus Thermoplasmatota archaeon]
MSKGTPSMGKRSKGKSHIICRRCGRHSFSISRGRCSHCGYSASSKLRNYGWAKGR